MGPIGMHGQYECVPTARNYTQIHLRPRDATRGTQQDFTFEKKQQLIIQTIRFKAMYQGGIKKPFLINVSAISLQLIAFSICISRYTTF